TNPELVEQHQAKVYSQASVGAPPMSVPHLDTRVIDGKKGLLFGPFAGWTPKFLKMGSFLDLPSSIRLGNLLPMANIGLTEMGLVKYLVTELAKNHGARVDTLRDFVPSAQDGEWEKVIAGQRVQVIKPNGRRGTLEFGTAVVNSADGSIAGLLGASPGASTAVDAMVDVLKRCFPTRFADWTPALEEMIPSLGRDLAAEQALFTEQFERSTRTLKLDQKA
ncbi:MAG TPA: malate:quinone oxidoreductase, partial [Dietzia sp.]|nr:malate:quinone oxidoreductase [Dietzia sp.]